jgi:restriction system protein
MPIPDYQSLMLPVLRFAGDRKEHSVADFRQRIAAESNLSDKELAERLASDSQTVFANRIGWAVQYLRSALALKAVRRGVYQITDRGLAILKEKPSEITVKTLQQFPEFLEFHGKGIVLDAAAVTTAPSPEVKETPEESLEHSYQALREALANELLDTIKNGTPAAFEKIVVDLLVAMGYGASVEDAGKVVGKSGALRTVSGWTPSSVAMVPIFQCST